MLLFSFNLIMNLPLLIFFIKADSFAGGEARGVNVDGQVSANFHLIFLADSGEITT